MAGGITYVNLPKFKTHSMTDVSLGIKNQWGFPIHPDRMDDHNAFLHAKIAGISALIKPDLTIIEGTDAVIHGHFPARKLAYKSVVPMGILIASKNVIAADMVGAKILGFDPESVDHIRIAADLDAGRRKDGRRLRWENIEILGRRPGPLKGESSILDEYPPGVRFMPGKERACREGCVCNPRATIQLIGLDYGGKGNFSVVSGKGHDAETLLKSRGDILLAGDCAISELGPKLFGLKNRRVLVSQGCNNLAACSLLRIPFTLLLPVSLPRGIYDIAAATLRRTTARIVPLRPVVLTEKVLRSSQSKAEKLNAMFMTAR
jgi:hypothetical protein